MTRHVSRSRFLTGSAAVLALSPRRVRAQQLVKVRLAGVQTDDLTPIYWGLKNGMYQKAGLDIEVIAANSGTAATTAVVAGTYELGCPITIVANGVVTAYR